MARVGGLVWLGLILLGPAVDSAAAEPVEGFSLVASLPPSHLVSARPRVSRWLDFFVNLKLEQGYALALGRLRAVPGCRALFQPFGADGLEKRQSTIYYGTTEKQEHLVCGHGSFALTMVGSPQTKLCWAFGRVDTRWAAMVVIHEALHFAGMTETPSDPSALTSLEINGLVKARCNL